MSVEAIYTCMNDLLTTHQRLNTIAKEMTDLIKSGDTEGLEDVLKKEEREILSLQSLEKKRVRIVTDYLQAKGSFLHTATISDIKPYLNDKEVEHLEQLQSELLEVVLQLKEQNNFNADLLQSSLQFVNLSLSLFQHQTDHSSYGRPTNKRIRESDDFEQQRSLFDSKA
jgi:flagellar biosynthesis/type III secretory pathway chaperone